MFPFFPLSSFIPPLFFPIICMSTRELGNLGERIAEAYLARKGYLILARQWKSPLGEIDLVAEKDQQIVIIEVKTRWSDAFGHPEEAVNADKRKRLARLSELYLRSAGFIDRPCRIDVLGIRMDDVKRIARVRHYQDILANQPFS